MTLVYITRNRATQRVYADRHSELSARPVDPPPVPPRAPTMDVEPLASRLALVTLRGDHDISSARMVADRLDRACRFRHVLVDLTGCTFVDATTIGLIARAHLEQRERGGVLELIVPAGSQPRRIATLAGLETFLTIHATRGAALDGIGPAV
ncbi:MAG TPA: STAS domain-containing protein [Gaiellales bacterium]|nr:STAS domain-containing protein [Gaiellales bacterium]